MSRTLRQTTGWLAALAILWAAMVPFLTHAWAAGSGSSWVEVCGTQGSKWVKVEAQDGDDQPSWLQMLAHCDHYLNQLPSLSTWPVSAWSLEPQGLRAGSTGFRSWQAASFAWTVAQPRAPPLKA